MENEKTEAAVLLDDACNLIEQGDFSGAEKKLSRAILLEPDNIEIAKTLGLAFINLEKYPEAIQSFDKVVRINEEDASSWFYLACCLEKEEEYKKAEDAYKRVISLREEYYDAYKGLGVLYLKIGEYEKIINELEKITTYGIDDFQSYYIMASAYMAIGNEYKSAEFLKKAHELQPSHIQIINNLTSCLIAIGKLDEAIEYLELGLKIDSENSQLNFNMGTIFQLKNNYKKAIEYFNKAYIQEPAAATLSSLASCMSSTGQFDAAYSYYKTLHVMYPKKQNYAYNFVNCAIECEKYYEALSTVIELLKKNPRSVDFLKKKGLLLRLLGNFKESIEVFDSLIERGKIDFEVYYNLGIAKARTKDLEGARDALRKCIQLEPNNPIARKDLGVIYLYMNLIEWAQDELKTAYELDNTDSEIIYNYAFCLYKGGNYNDADKIYKKLIRKDKTNSIYYSSYADNLAILTKIEEAAENYKIALRLNSKNAQAGFGLAKIYLSQKKYKVALELLEDLTGYTNDVEIFNTLGIVYQKLKEYKKAAEIFSKLYKIYPKNHILITNLAKCFLEMGEMEKAKQYAMDALDIYSDYEDAIKILRKVNKEDE